MTCRIQIIDLNQVKSPVAHCESREQNYEPETLEKGIEHFSVLLKLMASASHINQVSLTV
jgi:hypothetical protein